MKASPDEQTHSAFRPVVELRADVTDSQLFLYKMDNAYRRSRQLVEDVKEYLKNQQNHTKLFLIGKLGYVDAGIVKVEIEELEVKQGWAAQFLDDQSSYSGWQSFQTDSFHHQTKATKKGKQSTTIEERRAQQKEWARQKRQQIRLDAEKYEAMKAKERERYHQRKLENKINRTKDPLADMQRRAQKRDWARKKRQKMRADAAKYQSMQIMSVHHRDVEGTHFNETEGPSKPKFCPNCQGPPVQKERQRSSKDDLGKVVKENMRLKLLLKKESRLKTMYRKRVQFLLRRCKFKDRSVVGS